MPDTLLAIETATSVCSVALLQEGAVTVELTLNRPRAHAEFLVPMIREALTLGGLAAAALEVVAVSAGPGSYTGLRIGVSTAKGLAMATGARLVGVPSLEALAASVVAMAAPGDRVGAFFNARRDEVYAAAYRVGEQDHPLVGVAEPTVLHVDEVPAWLPSPTGTLWVVGNGAPRVRNALPPDTAARILGPVIRPSAAWVARQAMTRVAANQSEDLAAFEPFYLKAFVAKKPQGSIFEKLTF